MPEKTAGAAGASAVAVAGAAMAAVAGAAWAVEEMRGKARPTAAVAPRVAVRRADVDCWWARWRPA